jgi:histidyl-tRNA synthetase
LDYASKTNIPFVIFLGKEEAKKKKIKIRDMNKGKEKLVSVKEAMNILNAEKNIKR